MNKGLLANVFSDDGPDCTNGGVSSFFSKGVLIGEGVPEVFDADVANAKPGYVLMKNERTGHMYVVPESYMNIKEQCMFGGNFLYTCDSRFPSKYPLPIHDRLED